MVKLNCRTQFSNGATLAPVVVDNACGNAIEIRILSVGDTEGSLRWVMRSDLIQGNERAPKAC